MSDETRRCGLVSYPTADVTLTIFRPIMSDDAKPVMVDVQVTDGVVTCEKTLLAEEVAEALRLAEKKEQEQIEDGYDRFDDDDYDRFDDDDFDDEAWD